MNQFHFKGFEPDEYLKSKANASLNRLLDSAPYGSTGVALLERDEHGYRCSLDVYSNHGPFMASAIYSTPLEAIALIEKKLVDQISRWREQRFGLRDQTTVEQPKIIEMLTDRKTKPSSKVEGDSNKTKKEDHSYEYQKSTDRMACI